MEGRYIPAICTLVASFIACIICIVTGIPVLEGLKRVLIVVIVFYILGLIIKKIIVKTLLTQELNEDPEMFVEETVQEEEDNIAKTE